MQAILYKLFEHQYLGREESRAILQNIAQGKYSDTQVASFITVFLMRNIAVEELCGFRDALMEMCTPVDLSEYRPMDIVGTGGDGKNTFNISTVACFTLAGAGYHVVKHGNYGATSVSGASNVMEQHGIRFTTDKDKLCRSMDETNIAYLHAPLFNPAMKAVAPVRKSLAVRTFFNMLGPLANPAKPTYQLLGVYNLPLLRLYSYTFQASHMPFAVVHSLDGYDEVSLTGSFKVATETNEQLYTPEDIGFQRCDGAELYGGETPEAAARIFDNVLNNTATDAQRNVVVANAAFAIQVMEPEKELAECIAIARESLESGRALATLKKFIAINAE
ncbi:MAG: anthranilate phosphoribosyltransferase [Prevotellaceae bacterium]|jgi:anthranilate phosphoribosyltransferase|nr:anthranilate phosphoribosyltransferase [Prevotellaceae bacterium]